MNGRRIYHARGKVLGGSSSINGMIFQRGNPLDYERWAADPGMETGTTPTACRTSSGWRPACAGADDWRGGDGPLVLERGPATNPLFGAFFEAVQQAGYPLTDDVNGYRQEGFAALRPQHPPRPPAVSAARAYLHPVMGRQNLDVRDARAGHQGASSRASGPSASSTAAPGAADRTVDAGEVILCGGAINTPQLLQLSGVGDAGRPASRSASPWSHDLPGRRREPPGPPRGLHPVRLQAAGLDRARPEARRKRPASAPSGCSCRSGPGATNHFEGGGFARSNDDVDYPNLMFHFLPLAIRYDGSPPDRGPRLPGAHRADVLRRPRLRCKITSTDPREHPALRFNYLSTDERPARVGRGGPGRPRHPQPARLRAVQRRRALARARRSRPTRRSSTGSRKDAETALHPSLHRADGRRRRCRCVDPATMRVHGVEGLRVVDASVVALRHQRQHLRAGDDARREGRRPDPRATRRSRRRTRPFYRYRDDTPLLPARRPPATTARTPGMTDHRSSTTHDQRPRAPTASCRHGRRTSGRSSARRPTRSSARRTPTCPARSCRPRPAARVAVRDVSFDVAPGRGLRRHGPLRLRQVHAGPLPHPADRADRAARSRIDGEDITRWPTSAAARAAPAPRLDGLPALRAAAAPQGHRQRRLRPRGPRRGQGGAPRPGPGDGRPGRARRATRTPTPTSSPAACSSASAWPARWPSTPSAALRRAVLARSTR